MTLSHQWAWLCQQVPLGGVAVQCLLCHLVFALLWCQLVLAFLWFQLVLANCSPIRGSWDRRALLIRAGARQAIEAPSC